MTGVIAIVLKLGQLFAVLGPLVLEEAQKIKHLLELDPSFQVNLQNETGAAITADEATMGEINAWRQSIGLPPLS